MDIRPLTPDYAVSPQIAIEDLPAIRDAGYRTVIDNRPDAEIPEPIQTERMRAAAEALGLTFIANPVVSGAITEENVARQKLALQDDAGPILAYCASGNRSSVIWALAQAGEKPADWLIETPARHGYQLEWLRPHLG